MLPPRSFTAYPTQGLARAVDQIGQSVAANEQTVRMAGRGRPPPRLTADELWSVFRSGIHGKNPPDPFITHE